jgi:hypothetical protein
MDVLVVVREAVSVVRVSRRSGGGDIVQFVCAMSRLSWFQAFFMGKLSIVL